MKNQMQYPPVRIAERFLNNNMWELWEMQDGNMYTLLAVVIEPSNEDLETWLNGQSWEKLMSNDKMHPITKEYLECFTELEQLQAKFYNLYSKSMNDLAKNALPLKDTVDIGYFNNRAIKVTKDMQKFFRYRNSLCDKFVCLEDMKAGLNNLAAEKRFPGNCAVAYSRIRQGANVPNQGTVEHAQLMRWLGIDPVLWPKLNIKFNDLCDIISARALQGLPPPDGIGKAFPIFGAMYKRMKLVNDQTIVEEEEEETEDGEGSNEG